jgi:hypothetical protein
MLFLLSCSKKEDNPVTDPVPIDLTNAQAILIESGNEFAFAIFDKVIQSAQPGQNLMISP